MCVCVQQNGEQCTGRGDEINPCTDTENTHTRTVAAAAAGCDIVVDVRIKTQDTATFEYMLYSC